MHQPKLQNELNFPTPINTPALFESITIYVSNLEYLAETGFSDYMQYVRKWIGNFDRGRGSDPTSQLRIDISTQRYS